MTDREWERWARDRLRVHVGSGFDGARPSHRPLSREFVEALRNMGVSDEFLARVEIEPSE